MQLLLTHGYSIAADPIEQRIMKPYPPLGLLYLKASLSAAGFDVAVADPTFSTLDAVEARIRTERPPVVGIYVNLMTRQGALRLARFAKGQGARVVVGGPEPASWAAQYLERGVDVVVEGEGEQTMAELLPRLLGTARGSLWEACRDVKGLHLLDEAGAPTFTGERARITDLDALPFPDRRSIDLGRYLDAWKSHHGVAPVSLITARGCPFRCTWCAHGVYGYTYKHRSAANVCDEIEEVVRAYGPDSLWYADDVFTMNRRWFLDFAATLERRRLRLPFEAISREDRLDEEVVRTLASMGCRRLWVGAESGSQRLLDTMQRKTDAERVVEVVRLLQRHGIEAGMFIMYGFADEQRRDIDATVALLRRALPDIFLTTVAYPIQGTRYQREVGGAVVEGGDWERTSDRQRRVRGRPSRRYYSFVDRYVRAEVRRARLAHRDQPSLRRLGRSLLDSGIGKLGMALFSRERDA